MKLPVTEQKFGKQATNLALVYWQNASGKF